MSALLCCDRLQSSLANAGQRGIAVVVRRLPEFFIFYLQSRAVAFGEGEGLLHHRLEARINLVSTVGIRFCPWCGRRLDDLAETEPAVFAELAKCHQPFTPEP
jgi:hypothetical protein